MEMNQSETAFILNDGSDRPLLRWFTPLMEVDLCGHATLASAHIWLTQIKPGDTSVTFRTNVAGDLTVIKTAGGYTMDFPVRAGETIDVSSISREVLQSLSDEMPVEAYSARDLMLVYASEDAVRNARVDYAALRQQKQWLIITAPSEEHDFISRFFCIDEGMEDPVTGSAHCTLAPYWANRLGKTKLNAYQASKRGGALGIELKDGRVLISGPAVTVCEACLTCPLSP